MQSVEIIPMSHEDYLQGELKSDIRHEFYDGHVYAMAGAGEKHNIISGNLFSALRQKVRGTMQNFHCGYEALHANPQSLLLSRCAVGM